MSDYNWCHGPSCHTRETQSRVRGSGDNKVLRTIKIKENRYGNYQANIWNYFCNQGCLMDFIQTHSQSIRAIAPRREALETPIKIVKEQQTGRRYNYETSSYRDYTYNTKTIVSQGVDND